jgi:ribonuclease-3
MKDFSLLEKKLGVKFKDKNLLTQAFVHRSYSNENPDFELSDNERLEFLGDAILEKVVTIYLYLKYPDKSEGILTSWRSALVNAKMLAKIANELGFNDFLLLSQGEMKETGKARQYILADTMEAFIGALYLDQGISACDNFIKENILKELPAIVKNGFFKDAKSRLQEEAQEKIEITPNYKVIREWGPDHAKHFIVGVYFGKEMISEEKGSSKHEAEEAAAEKALKIKGW